MTTLREELPEHMLHRVAVSLRNVIVEGDGDPRHGTTNGYRHHGCRCDDCKRAWSVARQVQRAGFYAQGLDSNGKPPERQEAT